MNTGADILNLLPGNFKPVSNGEIAGKGNTSNQTDIIGSEAFNSMFFDLLGMGQVSAQSLMTVDTSNSQVNDSDLSALINNSELIPEEILAKLNLPLTSGELKNLSEQAANSLKNQLPIDNSNLNQKVNELINNNGINVLDGDKSLLSEGRYEVLDQEVKGGELKLLLKSEDNPKQTIKVSVPLSQLALNTNKPGQISPLPIPGQENRVALFADDSTPVNLEEQLKNLNVKELIVKEGSLRSGQNSGTQDWQIMADLSSKEIILRGQVKEKNVKAQPVTKDTTSLIADNREIPSQDVQSDNSDGKKQNSNNNQTAQGTLKVQPQEFNLWEKSSTVEDTKLTEHSRNMTELNTVKIDAPIDNTLDKVNMQPTRIYIPEDAFSRLKPDGKSIMIKIEPDYLGPARLHLHLNNNLLSARLSVDNIFAKTAVEGSLDKLVDQLAQQGIKVDHIQVNINNGGTQQNNFYRRPDWAQAENGTPRYDDGEMFLPEKEEINLSPRIYQPGYIDATGVNLLA